MKMKPISSLTTTLRKEVSLSTQKERTSTGSGTQLSIKQKTNALENLKKTQYPAKTDLTLRYTLDSITNCTTDLRYENLNLPTEKQFTEARSAVLASLVPLPIEELIQRLTHLTTLLRMPFGFTSPDDIAVRIKSMAHKLSDVPADIAIYAIDYIADHNKEFPSWSEVAAITKPKTKRRENILINIEKKGKENNHAITNNTS